ncbi:Integrator complex subunit 8 [Polyrhizophydium stewartii]|uniref:Integrator complex subunit 8 n=1 Tax=Polyrhizophydium stewartii TaxID=2732419 RepID=A0ABR4MW63_9FUNG
MSEAPLAPRTLAVGGLPEAARKGVPGMLEYVAELRAEGGDARARSVLAELVARARIKEPFEKACAEAREPDTAAAGVPASPSGATKVIALRDPQEMYLCAAARMALCMDLNVAELALVVPAVAVPYLLLSVDASEVMSVQHPFLLFSRYCILQHTAGCFVPPEMRESARDCAGFVDEAVRALLESEIKAQPQADDVQQQALSVAERRDAAGVSRWVLQLPRRRVRALLCQMVAELGMYHLVADSPDKAVEAVQLLRSLLGRFGLSLDEAGVDGIRLRRIESMCAAAKAQARERAASSESLLVRVHTRGVGDVPHERLIAEAIRRTTPMAYRRASARSARSLESGSDLYYVATLCNAVSVVLDRGKTEHALVSALKALTSPPEQLWDLLLAVPKAVVAHADFASGGMSADEFWRRIRPVYLLLYNCIDNPAWRRKVEACPMLDVVFEAIPASRIRPLFSDDKTAVLRTPLDGSDSAQQVYLRELLISRIQPHESHHSQELNLIISQFPNSSGTLLANSAQSLFEKAREQRHGCIVRTIVEVKRSVEYSAIIDELLSLAPISLAERQAGIIARVMECYASVGVPSLKTFKRLVTALLQSGMGLFEFTKMLLQPPPDGQPMTPEVVTYGNVSRILTLLWGHVTYFNGANLPAGFYTHGVPKDLESAPEQIIREIVPTVVDLVPWLCKNDGIRGDLLVVHQVIVDAIRDLENSDQLFCLIIGFFGGILSRVQPVERRFLVEALGPLSILTNPNLREWQTEGERNIAKICQPAAEIAFDDAERVFLLSFIALVSRAWASHNPRLSPIPHWMLADLAFVSQTTEDLKLCKVHQMNALVILSNGFSHLRKLEPVWESGLLRRIIECNLQLNDFVDAAFFVQLMPAPDYQLAFHALSHVPWDALAAGTAAASVEESLLCFWDIHMLEFITHHLNKHGCARLVAKMVGALGGC